MSGKRGRLDWAVIHRSLEERLARLGSTHRDGERVAALLRERAERLAAVPRDGTAAANIGRAIVLCSGGERYGLAIEGAREVTTLPRAAVLPGVGPKLLGIVNWRGDFIAMFDLGLLLGLTRPKERAASRVVFLRGEAPAIAIAVDAVEGIAEFDRLSLQPVGQVGPSHPELFRGATASGLVILDEARLGKVLRDELEAA
jgi:chemotaxis signal transduction protein